jgi:hypothetical protein
MNLSFTLVFANKNESTFLASLCRSSFIFFLLLKPMISDLVPRDRRKLDASQQTDAEKNFER